MPSQSVEYSESLRRYYRKIIDATFPIEAEEKTRGNTIAWREASEIMASALRTKRRLENG